MPLWNYVDIKMENIVADKVKYIETTLSLSLFFV